MAESEDCPAAMQSQKVASVHFTSGQILPFGFAEQRAKSRICVIHAGLVYMIYAVFGWRVDGWTDG